MHLNHITPEQQAEVFRQFRLAAMHRTSQWEAERAIERILGREIQIDITDYAVNADYVPAIDDTTHQGEAACISDDDILAAFADQ